LSLADTPAGQSLVGASVSINSDDVRRTCPAAIDCLSAAVASTTLQGGVGAASGALADKMIASGWDVRRTRVLLQVGGLLTAR
jgi:hypothetical protein